MRGFINIQIIFLTSFFPNFSFAVAQDRGQDLEIGAEMNASLNYIENEIEKNLDGESLSASSSLEVNSANLTLESNLSEHVSYVGRLDLISEHQKNVSLEFSYFILSSNEVSLLIGRQKIHQGGHDWHAKSFNTQVLGKYSENLARSEFEDAATFLTNLVGEFGVQIINDQTTDSGGQWNTRKHLSFVAFWHGKKFGSVSPLVHYGTEDNQHSEWFDFGLRVEEKGFVGTIDYSTVSEGRKIADGSSSYVNLSNFSVSTTLKLSYEFANGSRPFFYYSTFQKTQHTEDNEYNSHSSKSSNLQFDDNSVTVAVGSEFFSEKKKRPDPYFKIINHSGYWADDLESEILEKRSIFKVALGLTFSL
jgi:hypothetical protein